MSGIRVNPYINFQGRAREALEFYQRVLGGTIEAYAVDSQRNAHPAGPGERIQHALLRTDGAVILVTDGHPDYPAQVGEHMALSLASRDHDQADTLLHALAEGGTIKSPLYPQPWGGETGWLTDRFGINWMVRVMPA